MAQVTKVLVKRQVSDQVWYEAIDLQEYKLGQTHEISKNTESSFIDNSPTAWESTDEIRKGIPRLVHATS